ncbi:MAG: hypothetical protein MUO43_11650 [Desulfobacterales bacterium]|nr:hypothetical protein [Desulfobacterales bacterium]
MLGTDDTAAENADTSLLYAGEQYDSDLDHYYLRARYYNPWSGTFNRTDPFAGNTQDPQSLHKYLYCHNNPINAIDPTGHFTLLGLLFVFSISALVASIVIPRVIEARRQAIELFSERFLNDTQRFMESNGWNRGRLLDPTSPDNALLHTVASMIAVGSGADPEQALRSFQMRERGTALEAEMDRLNNELGNMIAQLPQQDKMPILQSTGLWWIEIIPPEGGEEILERKIYPKPGLIEALRPWLAMYNLTDPVL